MKRLRPLKNILLIRIAITVLFAVVVLSSNFGISKGQLSSWSVPKALSSEESFSWFPDIAADSYGNLHVVWSSGIPGYDTVIYTNLGNGNTVRSPNDIFALPQNDAGSAATRPSLLVDVNSRLNISFVDLTTVYYSNAQVWNTSNTLGWLPRAPMSGNQTAYFSKMAIDSKNTIHFIYTENVPAISCSSCYHIFYRQSVDNGITWTTPVDLINKQVGAAKPQILIDKRDNIHIVWESGQGGGLGQLTDPTEVTYTASYDGGKTWAKPINFFLNEGEMGKNITIGFDRYNRLVVAWWSLPADWIMYQVSEDSGRSWSDPTPIPDLWGAAAVYQSNLDDYAMANDSSGNIHLVAVGRIEKEQEDLNIVDVVWNGNEWSKPDVITTYVGDVPEWPRIAVNKGNQLNVVWFVRDEAHIWESDKGRYRVWYSNGYAESPAVRAAVMPTMTPTIIMQQPAKTIDVTVTATNQPDVTSEPTLNLTDQSPPVSVPLSETDYIPLLAKALFPSILFVVGIVVVALIRRR